MHFQPVLKTYMTLASLPASTLQLESLVRMVCYSFPGIIPCHCDLNYEIMAVVHVESGEDQMMKRQNQRLIINS